MNHLTISEKIFFYSETYTDYAPIVSSVTNLVYLVAKLFFVCFFSREVVRSSNIFHHIYLKNRYRCIALMVPILGNVLVCLADRYLAKYKEFKEESWIDHSDRTLALKAVKEDGLNLKYLFNHLKADKDVVRKAILENPTSFRYADPSLKRDKKLFLSFLDQIPLLIFFAHPDFFDDEEVIKKVYPGNDWAYVLASPRIKNLLKKPHKQFRIA